MTKYLIHIAAKLNNKLRQKDPFHASVVTNILNKVAEQAGVEMDQRTDGTPMYKSERFAKVERLLYYAQQDLQYFLSDQTIANIEHVRNAEGYLTEVLDDYYQCENDHLPLK